MRSRRSDLAETTKHGMDELDKRHGSLIDQSGIPILGASKGRQQSYGSCDNARADVNQNTSQPNGNKRHQIGSEVLDFGESPAVWQGTTTQRLSKKPSHRTATSMLPFLDGVHDPQAVVRSSSKRSFFAPFSKDLRNADSESMGQVSPKKADSVKKTKSVFSLFGLDGTIRGDCDTAGNELGVLLSNTGRPRANAITSLQLSPSSNNRSRSCACPHTNLRQDGPKSRAVSWSRYLDEISRIGANGVSDATLMDMTNVVHNDYQPVLSEKTGKTRIADNIRFNKVANKSSCDEASTLATEMSFTDPMVEIPLQAELFSSSGLATDTCAEVSTLTSAATENEVSNLNTASSSVEHQIGTNKAPDVKLELSQQSLTTPAANTRKASTGSNTRIPAGSTTRSKKIAIVSPKAIGKGPGGSIARVCSESACSRGKRGRGSYRGRNAKRGGSVRVQKK